MARLTATSLAVLAGLTLAPVAAVATTTDAQTTPISPTASRDTSEPNVIGDLLSPGTDAHVPEGSSTTTPPLLAPGPVRIPLPSPAAPEPLLAPPRPLLTDDPAPGPGREWSLTASLLVLRDVRYHGHDADGALVFTASGVELTDMQQRAGIPGRGEVGIAAQRAELSSRGQQRVELRVRRLTGTLAVAGLVGAPVQLAAPLLPNTPEAAAVELSELTLRDAIVHVTSTTAATLALQEAHVTTHA